MSATTTTLVTAPPASPDRIAMAEQLRLTPLFDSLEDRLIDGLASCAHDVRLPAEAELCRQGTMPQHLHVLLAGQVALWATAQDDSRAAVEVVRPPGYFVLATVLTRLPYLITAQTVSSAHLLLIDIDGLHALLAREAGLANALLRAEALNFRSLVRQVQDLKLRTAAQRLGCRQENLSRAFATLRGMGVETHGALVLLHDIPALRAFAVPDEQANPDLPLSG